MGNNSSSNVYVDIDSIINSVSLSPPYVNQVNFLKDFSISIPNITEIRSVPADSLAEPFYDVLEYLSSSFLVFTNNIEGNILMPNIIYTGDSASINVSTLVLADKMGSGNCILTSPSGTSYIMKGVRLGFENITGNMTIEQHRSGYTWTNLGAGNITVTLSSGLATGTTALFIRTGGAMNINPSPSGRIWNMAGGFFYSQGSGLLMASSGSKLGLICDGNNRWYPTMEYGTINPL